MISAETIDQTLEEMYSMTPDQVQSLINKMSKEQPAILAYLLAASEYEEFSEDEAHLFMYIGVVVWQLMRQRPNGKIMIKEKHLEKIEKENEDQLDKMASDSAGDFITVAEEGAKNYPEPEVLRYLVEALIEDEDEGADNSPVREENLGYAYLYLKNVLDAFVRN